MIISLALLLAPSALPAIPTPALTLAVYDEELDSKIAAAGEDVDKLWEVRVWLIEQDRTSESRTVLEKILEIDPDHEDAHRALSHHFYDGKWFTSYASLSAYRREEAKRMKEKGLVRFGDGWAPEADVPFMRMQWEQLEDGSWMSPHELQRRALDAQKEAEGWVRHDTLWVSPEEAEKAAAGLFKCGDEWLAEAEADAYHSEIGKWWEYPSTSFVSLSTLGRRNTTWVGYWADHVYADLVRIIGLQPEQKPELVCFATMAQYNAFAAGDQAAQRAQTETDGFSSLHYSFFADSWFDAASQPPRYRGCGVAYWEVGDANLAPYGRHSIQHAAAQSYLEAVDPSWDALSQVLSGQAQVQSTDAFWAEKRIPKWLRYGAASYVERYFVDAYAGDGGNPLWARQWGFTNLEAKGGLRSLELLFDFPLDLNQIESSTQYIHEAGAVVAFILDGECEPVITAHEALKAALIAGEDPTEATTALQEALMENESKLRAFARP